MLLDASTWAKLGWDNLPSSALKGKSLLISKIPWASWADSGLHMQPGSPKSAFEPLLSGVGCGQGARSSLALGISDVFLHLLPPLRHPKP